MDEEARLAAFKERFEQALKALNMTRQKELVPRTGAGEKTISAWVQRGRMSNRVRRRFEEMTNISFDWLNTGDGQMVLPGRRPISQPIQNESDTKHIEVGRPSRFTRLDHATLLEADKWLRILQKVEEAEFTNSEWYRLFADLYEQISADGGALSEQSAARFIARAQQREKQAREGEDGTENTTDN